jgi:hypothetical protein
VIAAILVIATQAAPDPELAPLTLSAEPAHVGQTYDARLRFAPGAKWSLTSGALPPGVALSNDRLSGTPSQPGAYTFTVHAQSGVFETTHAYTLFVSPSKQYDDRVETLLHAYAAHPVPPLTGCNPTRGAINQAIAELWLNNHVEEANAALAKVRLSGITGQNCNRKVDARLANLWLGYLIRPYYLFGAKSNVFPGRLTTQAEDNLSSQMWAYARRYSKLVDAACPWRIADSENHDAQAKSFDLLAAQMFATDSADRRYADGSTPQQQVATWTRHWSDWFDTRAKYGLLVEAGSPSYTGYTMQAVLNIYNFSQDATLRTKAGMFLDLVFADFAQQSLQHVAGGAKSRSYPRDRYDGSSDTMTNFADLLFDGGTPARNNHELTLATSGYSPPAPIAALAQDPVARGAFEDVTRRPGVGFASSTKELAWSVNPLRSVVDYSDVTPEYVMGTAELQPSQTRVGPSSQNRWQGVIFGTGPGDRVYPQAGRSTVEKTEDAFVSVQKKNVLITRKDGYASQPTLVYFPSTLAMLDARNGWLFARAGNAYLAVRPAAGSYRWLTTAKNHASRVADRFIALRQPSVPIIFDVASANAYPSFGAFEARIMRNGLRYERGVLRYTSSDGTVLQMGSVDSVPRVNGVPISFAPPDLFASPFVHSRFGSGLITVTADGETLTYDFRDRAHPRKTAS